MAAYRVTRAVFPTPGSPRMITLALHSLKTSDIATRTRGDTREVGRRATSCDDFGVEGNLVLLGDRGDD